MGQWIKMILLLYHLFLSRFNIKQMFCLLTYSPIHSLVHWWLPGSLRESPKPSGQDPNLWTVEEVMQYIRDIDPVLAPHADLFRKHVRIHWSHLLQCMWSFCVAVAPKLSPHSFLPSSPPSSSGDWRQGPHVAAQRHDDEIHGPKARPRPQTHLPHWQAEAVLSAAAQSDLQVLRGRNCPTPAAIIITVSVFLDNDWTDAHTLIRNKLSPLTHVAASADHSPLKGPTLLFLV